MVTSVTIGPAGGVIGPVRIDGLLVTLTIPPGTFTTPVQITLTAPTGRGIGARGHPGYRPVGGVGVLVQVNGKAYTGNFAHRLTLTITGFSIGPRDRVGEWNGTTFQFIGANATGHTVVISFVGSEDFAIFAPTGGGGGGGRFGAPRAGAARTGGTTAVTRARHMPEQAVLTSLYLAPAGSSPAGIGVLAPAWLAASSR